MIFTSKTLKISDKYRCSGICQPSLFFFNVNITEGFPKQTCLNALKNQID
jgi:hypothetical protein